jgi:predicted nucleic acid-binding protein
MLVLDASVLIGLLNESDPHHTQALRLFETNSDRALLMNPVTKGEFLVNPARAGRLDEGVALLDALGISEVPFGADAAVRLASLRAQTGSTMPDCCVLLAAQQARADIATFDDRLRRSAERLGITVI